jgi:ferredoxin
MMNVHVDADRCEANAICASLVPEVFDVGQDDNMRILQHEVPKTLSAVVRQAVRQCPKAALTIDE